MGKKTTLLLSMLSALNIQVAMAHSTGFYADKDNNQVLTFEPQSMKIKEVINSIGDSPYPIDKAGDGQVYVTTRNTQSLDVISSQTLEIGGVIPLNHFPRSVTYNKSKKLAAVSGTKKAVTSIIDTKTNEVIATVGNETPLTVNDFGGGLATGHPFWVSEKQFLILDRARRTLELYEVGVEQGSHVISHKYTLATPTSVHHIMSTPNATGWSKNVFYAVLEGSPKNGVAPGIMAFELSDNKLYQKQIKHMPATATNVGTMGAHHASFHPDGVHIYLGSNEGKTFVINSVSMEVVSTIETGKGNGHTTMIPGRMLAVSTNHTDTFMTVIDLITHKKVTDIEVSPPASSKSRKTQSHTSSFDPKNDRYFYTAASDDGRILEIDLDTFTISREIEMSGSYPIQGTFVW
ncbi:YncE family protein [Pseudoalteromonas obscura]|uniref:Uncharacterized protein n=1 Tax=Pseudoalteromonas obscura TaxID=3048491 RepID=A0ABT7ENE4_9GAMM|nr:hypothetical protein [Pseudoalteromonas sp. P94(2023)]MDK2596567.1 hypothetical protein [Pseudoalteromonas sp. P94(2023)]